MLSPVCVVAGYGATSFDVAKAEIARAMATAAKRVFILADHAKIGLTSRVGFCPVERIDTLIVDARAEGSPGPRAQVQDCDRRRCLRRRAAKAEA